MHKIQTNQHLCHWPCELLPLPSWIVEVAQQDQKSLPFWHLKWQQWDYNTLHNRPFDKNLHLLRSKEASVGFHEGKMEGAWKESPLSPKFLSDLSHLNRENRVICMPQINAQKSWTHFLFQAWTHFRRIPNPPIESHSCQSSWCTHSVLMEELEI